MSSRSFTVFVDTPSTDTPQPKDNISEPVSPSASAALAATISSILSPVTATDKENLDPVTGEPVVPNNTNQKKRKTIVLATKTLTPLEPILKDSKEAAEGQPETKKRKSSISSGSKSKSKKDGKGTGSVKKSVKKVSRRASPMPKVEEEGDLDREAREQALVDSRCKDLTVKPLADVSEAYIECGVFGGAGAEGPAREEFRWMPKESSCEPEIRDYLTTAHLSASTSSSTLRGSSPACEPKVFSTPERKKIYSAFTFKSPSPIVNRVHESPSDSVHLGPLNFGELDRVSS
ncbi:hypothetical protein Moror_6222 [Moniliophthora roreri MCA 2997]|uniref:Uncharacterized protein n=1 Tax=Moniliophthora roreri (strain MCA 2997) TaxID=1381753 RepID=V2WC95_MONRO|nr:hypothetical protein Moror_6222 [Moniliophthora roreri MCA 2997]